MADVGVAVMIVVSSVDAVGVVMSSIGAVLVEGAVGVVMLSVSAVRAMTVLFNMLT